MNIEYKETEVGPDDAATKIMDTLADGHPWVFTICRIQDDGGLDMTVHVGGGVGNAKTAKAILTKAINSLP